MSHVLRLALVDPHDASREKLKSNLLGLDSVWLEAECSRYEFFADVVTQTNPDVGIIALDSNPDRGLALVRELHQSAPQCVLVVTSSSTDGELILSAMRSGVKEFIPAPVKIDDLVGALERIADQKWGRGENRSRGSNIISVCGATGGVGTTSLAVNLGCALASEPSNTVALVDIDMCLGDADVFLDTIPDFTLVDVAQNVTRLDFTLLKRSLTKHSSGLYLLPRPVQLEEVQHVMPDDLRRVIGLLKATFSHVIIDCSKGYSANDMVALELSNHILMVTQLDLPCLRNVVRLLMSFNQMPAMKDKLKIVVNRVGLDSQIGLKKAQETIGREIFWQLPNDYRTMVEVRNNGVPLIEQAPKAAITQAVYGLAEALEHGKSDTVAADDKVGKKSWLAMFGGKK